MALATTSGAVTFNITANTNQLDLSEELAEIIRSDNTSFISRLMGGMIEATQTRHYWDEDSLISNQATESGVGINTAVTSVAVVSGQGTRFKIGTLFRDRAKGKTEVMQVTAVSTDTLTIVRQYGGTTAESHAASFIMQIIAHTRQEDQDISEDDTKERTSVNNVLQIFQRGVRIAYDREKVKNNGIASEFAHQVAYRLKEEMRALDSSVINSVKSTDAGSSTSYRSMGGLLQYTSATGGNVRTTVENLVETVVNDMAEDIVNDAGQVENGFLLCSPKLRRTISTFDQAFRRGDFNATRAGYYVERYITDMGFELEVIQDPWMLDDVVIVGDLSRCKMVCLQSDQMRFEELAKLGRSYRGQITGSYSFEIRNALQAFAYHNNLS